MPICVNPIAKRLARWMLTGQAPAHLALDHPAQEDLAAGADEIERLRAALVQIRDVCDDNAPASCNQELALKFVRDVADGAIQQS